MGMGKPGALTDGAEIPETGRQFHFGLVTESLPESIVIDDGRILEILDQIRGKGNPTHLGEDPHERCGHQRRDRDRHGFGMPDSVGERNYALSSNIEHARDRLVEGKDERSREVFLVDELHERIEPEDSRAKTRPEQRADRVPDMLADHIGGPQDRRPDRAFLPHEADRRMVELDGIHKLGKTL